MKKQISSKFVAGVLDVPHSKIIDYACKKIQEHPYYIFEFKFKDSEVLMTKLGLQAIIRTFIVESGLEILIELADGLE